MSVTDLHVQLPAQRIAGAWRALPAWLPVPGLGALPVNAFLLKGREPMLVDAGLAALSDDFAARLGDEIDLEDLRWIWVSHTDADHVGNLDRILDAAPEAVVITSFLGAGKMGMMGIGDPARIRLAQPGDTIEIGGRSLHVVRPPYYDAPETLGFFDAADRVLFSADAFGALLPGPVDRLDDVPPETLREGLLAWSSIDAPWLETINPRSLGETLDGLDRLEPAHLLSGHLPVAAGLGRLSGTIRAAYGRCRDRGVTSAATGRIETAIG